MPNPLSEVFGFPCDDFSAQANRCRGEKLCPFGNKVPKCTKVSVKDPLGVCSIWDGKQPVIICPVRFRQDWIIARDAASFFFAPNTHYDVVPEMRLVDEEGSVAGNIDIVLIARDETGRIVDYGALEVQSVYISGNIREAFDHYYQDPKERAQMDWEGDYYPRPDYLSSSRKRLVPQLIFKGGILRQWGRKIAVALNTSFFETLPPLPTVGKEQASLAWFLYDLRRNEQNLYNLTLNRTVYTNFSDSLGRIMKSAAGAEPAFIERLERKCKERRKRRSLNEGRAAQEPRML